MIEADVPGGFGTITSGVDSNALLTATVAFIERELPKWRDDPERPAEEVEERLNSQLCKRLSVVSREECPLVHFSHEEPQGKKRSVDMAVAPRTKCIIGGSWHTLYDPFLVIEGKRLPAPPPRSRRREYVSGGTKITGGIQRFKLSVHGNEVTAGAIVGYIQSDAPHAWLERINSWIGEFAEQPGSDGCNWSADDRLFEFREDVHNRVAVAMSKHRRKESTHGDMIALRHLWVVM